MRKYSWQRRQRKKPRHFVAFENTARTHTVVRLFFFLASAGTNIHGISLTFSVGINSSRVFFLCVLCVEHWRWCCKRSRAESTVNLVGLVGWCAHLMETSIKPDGFDLSSSVSVEWSAASEWALILLCLLSSGYLCIHSAAQDIEGDRVDNLCWRRCWPIDFDKMDAMEWGASPRPECGMRLVLVVGRQAGISPGGGSQYRAHLL